MTIIVDWDIEQEIIEIKTICYAVINFNSAPLVDTEFSLSLRGARWSDGETSDSE